LDSEDSDEEMEEEEDDDDMPELKQLSIGKDEGEVVTPPAMVSLPSLKPPLVASLASSVSRMPSLGLGMQTVNQRPAVSYCWTPPYIKTSYPDSKYLLHQFILVLLPSGLDQGGVRVSMSVYGGEDFYLMLEIDWPHVIDSDNCERFLTFLKNKKLQRLVKKWMGEKTPTESTRAKKEFDDSWVMLEMHFKQEIIKMRNAKHSSVLRSQTCMKMDFPVERLTEDCWDLIGDPDSGVRVLVVDLAQAIDNEECKQGHFDRKVEMIEIDMDD